MELKIAELAKEEIIADALEGLSKEQKELPCKLFYDEKGSALFDEICLLDEYYPTRTEIGIMEKNIKEISAELGEDILLVELGSGSSIKTRLLLDNLQNLKGYIPVDISAEYLFEVSNILKDKYPFLDIYPLAVDYTKEFVLPVRTEDFSKTVFYFPGSTIGNFTPHQAKLFLSRLAAMISGKGGLLIGVDLQKNNDILENAYNDNSGITAEFNLNILDRLNKEAGANFNLKKFRHKAFYNTKECRIEMHLISTEYQKVRIDGTPVRFRAGEYIITEYSYKYTPKSFGKLVGGEYELDKVWLDKNNLFSVQYFNMK